ncbi:MAG: HopJ type III effector protein [Pseudomonadales bacterium]|nr:HopJ type III effector protein [Pseudomonadales bacterium]
MSDKENKLLEKLKVQPETIVFQDVIAVIDANYKYSQSAFVNGKGDKLVNNAAGSNEGSCKIFAFSRLHQLTKIETLHCFGDYYRHDVLGNPEGIDHANIRAFMESGWEEVSFDSEPLQK